MYYNSQCAQDYNMSVGKMNRTHSLIKRMDKKPQQTKLHTDVT